MKSPCFVITSYSIHYTKLYDEDNVELIADNTFRPDDLAAGKHYTAKGGTAWDYADLNRIENNLKLLYEGFVDIFGGLKILKFELGGGLFG